MDTLAGQFLVATPSLEDTRFERSIIFVCSHNRDGAMGLIINQPASNVTFPELVRQLELIDDDHIGALPTRARNLIVLKGGPVEKERGFVLHSGDFAIDGATLQVTHEVGMTATMDILRDIANGTGPHTSMMALGYAGWAPGQLESELRNNDWLHGPANADILFDQHVDDKYERVLETLGINLAFLSNQTGSA